MALRMPKVLGRFLDLEDPERNVLREQWDLLRRLPGGRRLFSAAVGLAAPYTGSIHARVVELREGHSRVEMDDVPSLRNHLRCVHAVALVNLAELAGNVALAYSLPADARFIVAGLSIEYVKKARGTITAVGAPPRVDSSERREYEVPVVLSSAQGEVVARATLQTLVGPKRAR